MATPMIPDPSTTKLFCCDLNWSRFRGTPTDRMPPSEPGDWADVDPQEYFNWHREFGNNVMFCQAYAFGGYAFYPSKLGPVAPRGGTQLLPKLYELAHQAGMPFWSYFCVGTDLDWARKHPEWCVPGSVAWPGIGFLGPETPWTDVLCDRIHEFLTKYPVEWILFDWFVYGFLNSNEGKVLLAPFVKKPFQEIIGRPMPEKAEEVTPEESLKYRREILARQFRRIRDTVKQTSPGTKITFNVPYWVAREPLWIDHPMLNESDGLFAESSGVEVVEWLLSIRQPKQRVMTTVIGRVDDTCDAQSWRRWHQKGCDLFGYAWGQPPDFRPVPAYDAELKIVREAFQSIK